MSKRNDNDAAAQPAVPWLVTVMVWLMRVVVGGTFVFSGMVKAIDPWGTYYKIQEYLLTCLRRCWAWRCCWALTAAARPLWPPSC